ncbi:hypothetical protein [Aeromicrobium sp. 179-A 4D2 NHS]|uniref:hypothetical protein n=1 Tax=Aeromicrobium sp. 179-A 4D2 NHS TaxID=3142375 RepID=UPI0039A3E8B1
MKADQPRNADGTWGEKPRGEPVTTLTGYTADKMFAERVDALLILYGLRKTSDGLWFVPCDGCDHCDPHENCSAAAIQSGVKFHPDLYRSGRDRRRLCLSCREVESVDDPGWLW